MSEKKLTAEYLLAGIFLFSSGLSLCIEVSKRGWHIRYHDSIFVALAVACLVYGLICLFLGKKRSIVKSGERSSKTKINNIRCIAIAKDANGLTFTILGQHDVDQTTRDILDEGRTIVSIYSLDDPELQFLLNTEPGKKLWEIFSKILSDVEDKNFSAGYSVALRDHGVEFEEE